MNRKLSLNFQKFNEPELSKLAMIIVTSMTDNIYFPYPQPMLINLDHLQQQFQKALSDAASGDIVKISAKNDIKAKLITALKSLGDYVENAAEGKMTPLLSSGFPLFKDGTPAFLSAPEGFRVSPGLKNGEIILKMRRVIGAKSYLYQYTPDPLTKDSVWEMQAGTRCSAVLTNLPLGIKYWFRMAAIGPRNQIVYTEALCRFIA